MNTKKEIISDGNFSPDSLAEWLVTSNNIITTTNSGPIGNQGPTGITGITGAIGPVGIPGSTGKRKLQNTPHVYFYKGALELLYEFHRISKDEHEELHSLLCNDETLMLAIKKLDLRRSELAEIKVKATLVKSEYFYKCLFLGLECNCNYFLQRAHVGLTFDIPISLINKVPLVHSLVYVQDEFYNLIKENNK